MAYRRGFKSEANATAREIRAELGLKDLDKLDPWALAAYLLVPVESLSDYLQDAHEPCTASPRSIRARSRRVPCSTELAARSSTTTCICLVGRRAT